MADTKISAETSAGALNGAEISPVVRGSGSPPTYSNLRTTTQDIANLGRGLIGTLTASSSAVLDFTGLTGTHWRVVGKFLKPATDAANSLIRFGTGAGPTYTIAGYYAGGTRNGVTVSSTAVISSTNVNGWYLGQSQENTGGTGQGQSFVLDIVTDNANWVHLTGIIVDHASGDGHTRMGSVGGIVPIAAQLTALRYMEDSGNIASGKLSLYSVAD